MIGNPAKSDGSRIDAITTSHGNPAVCATARITDVLPVPGEPHSSTGTPAAIAVPSASTVVACASIDRFSVPQPTGARCLRLTAP